MSAEGGGNPASSLLHLRCGHDILAALDEAQVPGTKAAWADPLCEGPVPGSLDRPTLRRQRAAWLAGHLTLEEGEVAKQLATADALVETADAYAEVVLWFEHDLYDQIILLWLMHRLGPRVRAGRPVTLICIDRHPDIARFTGLGELSPPALAGLFRNRRPVTPDQVDLADAAWAAYTAPSPLALLDLITRLDAGDSAAPLPFLAAALRRHAQEFPWKAEGLSLTEWLALDCIDIFGGLTGAEAFWAVHGREAAPWQGDLQFFAVLRRLAAWQPEPLLAIDGDDWPRAVSLRTTDAGRAVLLGKRDALDHHPLDCWRGGVHLYRGGPDWRWDAGAGTLIRLR